MSMRICLITNLYPPYTRGGAERVVATIAHTLKENGHAVFVITTVPSFTANMKALASGGFFRETVHGIMVYRIATANLFPYWTIGEHNGVMRFFWHVFDMFAFETAATVRRILRKEKPDVVMTHNLMGIGFLIPRAIRRLGMRHMHIAHDVQLAVPSGLFFVGAHASFLIAFFLQQYERIVRWLIGSPGVVVAPSQWLLNFYTERGFFPQSKKVVLHNPISTPSHILPEQRRRHLQMFEKFTPSTSSGNKFLKFLYVGQLERHKGVLFLLDTIKKLEIGNWKLEIVGSGLLLSQIKKMAADDLRIHIHGAVPHEKLSAFYTNADVLVVPSLVHENAPTVIFEAFAHGVPVIASRVGGIPEFVRDGVTGWTFTAGEVSALHEQLQYCSEHRAILKQYASNCRAAVHACSPEQYVVQLLGLIL